MNTITRDRKNKFCRANFNFPYLDMVRILLFAYLLISFSSCESLEEQIQRSVTDLSEAERRIDANSANIVQILKDIKSDYKDDVKDIINNDVDRLIKTTVYSTGTEARCEVDFLAKRVKADLNNTVIRLKNLLRKQENQKLLPLASLSPVFCNCNPDEVDLNINNPKSIKFYGYDFDDINHLKVYSTKDDGTKLDISQMLAKPTNYELTLGVNQISNFVSYNKIKFYYNDVFLYDMLIIPKSPKICKEEDFIASPIPQSIEFAANLIHGDADFAGDVDVECKGTYRLSSDNRSIICNIEFIANESDGNTRSYYKQDHTIFTAKSGYIIKSILTPTTYWLRPYVQKGKSPEPHAGDGFVASASIRADRKGDDVNGYTGATLSLANINVSLVEDGVDCVSKEIYASFHTTIQSLKDHPEHNNPSSRQISIIKSIDSKNQ